MSLSPNTLGLPIPVGTKFRHRIVEVRRHPRDERLTPHVLCVFDHPDGPMIEARPHHSVLAVVCDDIEHHHAFGPDDVVAVVKAALALDGGWTVAKGRRCSVSPCRRGLPMSDSAHPGSGTRTECLVHRARTVESCASCGRPDLPSTIDRPRLLAAGLCWTCDYWMTTADEVKPNRVVTPEGRFYSIGDGRGPTKGFGGRRFVVCFSDGREVVTDDLWTGGDIPERHRSLFTVNATVTAAD